MIKTFRENKARLSEPVEQGEDILITVRGKVKARITRATPAGDTEDLEAWAERLRRLQAEFGTGNLTITVEEILRQDRGR